MNDWNPYYNRAGEPISQEEGSRLLGNVAECQVALDYVVLWAEAEVTISTVHLVIDHALGNGPPIIFETMVFPQQEVWGRYSTEEAARAGHAVCVAAVRDGTLPELSLERHDGDRL